HLEGLPEGVGVVRYEGGAVKAGSYTVRAVLSYDSRNYNAPRIDEVSFVIEKKAVEIPTLSPLEYNGKIQLPTDLGDELTVLSDGFKNSGTYKVTLTLKDTENYSFTGTDSDKVEVDLIIKPRPVFVGASDVLIYKWSKEPEVTLTVTEGGVLQGDTAEFKCVLSGGKVQYVSTNGNYEPIIIGGEVIYLNRPTPAVSAAITLSAILLALLLFAVFIAYLKRDRLLSYIAARKCKRRIQTQKPLLGVVNPYTDDGALPPVPLAAISAFSVEMAHADSLISDSLAKNLVKRESDTVYTEGKRRATVNIDTLSEKFSPGETVDINSLKSKGIVPQDSAYVKVLARGQIDKALTVLANDFSLCAVKMIVLAGGEARRVNTVKLKKSKEKR
ncbi:MAG: uL15 family ribosomal protein, partial [Clostridia bacterium]|nr:uL15 family ribosomal protein [Clostridia bacterium]